MIATLDLHDYVFVPCGDITAYELALLLPLIIHPDVDGENLLITIKTQFYDHIYRHIQKRNESVKDDFKTAASKAIAAMEGAKTK